MISTIDPSYVNHLLINSLLCARGSYIYKDGGDGLHIGTIVENTHCKQPTKGNSTKGNSGVNLKK